ncbi:MAG: diguanylate cyclase [Clostridia bacterium]|nr:diguanylate cyclase [Clostridia bacterium]
MDQTPNFYGDRLAGPLLEQIGEHLSGGIVGCRWEEGFPFYYINDRFLAFTGYTYEEFYNVTDSRILAAIHPDDQGRVTTIINSSLSRGDNYQVEYRIRQKGGGYAWLRGTGKRMPDSTGRESIISVSIDITEAMELRRKLVSKSRELSHLMDSIPCGIAKVKTDEYLTLEFANEFFYHMFGYAPAEAREAGFRSARFIVYPPDWRTVSQKIKENMARGSKRFELEHRCIKKSGEILWVLARCSRDEEERDAVTCAVLDITDRKQIEEQLRISEEENRIAARHTGNTIDIYEVSTRTLTQPQEDADILGIPAVITDMPWGMLRLDAVMEPSREDYIHLYESMNRGVPTGSAVFQMKGARGQTIWADVQYTMIFGEDGTPQRAVISYEDVTERREKELAYQKWSQYFETQQIDALGYYEYDLTKDVYSRSEGTQFESLPPEIGTFTDMANYIATHFVCEEDIPEYNKLFNRKNLLLWYYEGKREIHLEHRRLNEKGESYWVLGSIQLIPDPYSDDVKAFVMIKNIDEKKKHALQLKLLSERDTLTGLFNRRMVVDKISAELQRSGQGMSHAVIMLDIDHFKLLNDSFGHRFGDMVIQELAAAMQRQLRPGDFCGRLGGDEFVIFMRDIPGAAELEPRIASLSKTLAVDYEGKGRVSVSMGLAVSPRDGMDFDTLYQKADVALYEAKRSGRSGYVIYQPGQ